MQYIGSIFVPEISSPDFRDLAIGQLDSSSLPSNGFNVLALLLAAIATHSQDLLDQGRAFLDRAIYMALDLKMNSRMFANMEYDPVLAECWRRTYWGLYITDSIIAGIQQQPTFL